MTTTYNYDSDPDRLTSEVQIVEDGPCAMIPWRDNKYVYAYAGTGTGGGVTYKLPGIDVRIGQFGAFFIGLPSVWSKYLLIAALILVPLTFFGPAGLQYYRRLRRLAPADAAYGRPLSLRQRCICVFLAYVMLLSPSLQQIAHADTAYSSLDISTWGSDDTTITYDYDANGSLTSKVTSVTSTTDITEAVDSTYNLQGRLETVTTAGVLEDLDSDTYDDDRYVEVASYTYSPDGIRVSADVTRYNVTDYGEAGEAWAKLSSSTTDYLIDPYNHTGHAQVIEETIDGTNLTRIQYTIGDDVISQTESTYDSGWTASDTEYLLYDGHGSTRQLANSSGTVIDGQNYSYDGYGVMLSDDSAASGADVAAAADTTMLYAGEQYDSSASMYYNRARYYNPSNGLFNRVDPYAGNIHDPQSLHKYAYCHNNPINVTDPTGTFGSMGSSIGAISIIAITMIMMNPTVVNAPRMDGITYPDNSGDMIIDGFYMLAGALLIQCVIVPVVRRTLRYIGRGLRPIGGVSSGPGKWYKVKEGMKPRAVRYQTQISGRPVDNGYVVNTVKFDGFKGGKLLDAKGPGYKNFIKKGKFRNWFRGEQALIDQANRQIRAAGGVPIEWHIAEKETLAAMEKILEREAIKEIKLIYTPFR